MYISVFFVKCFLCEETDDAPLALLLLCTSKTDTIHTTHACIIYIIGRHTACIIYIIGRHTAYTHRCPVFTPPVTHHHMSHVF